MLLSAPDTLKRLMLAVCLFAGALCACVGPSRAAEPPITMASLLRQESDVSTLSDLHTWSCALQSSYDRTGGDNDKGNFLSGDGKDAILADLNGPGAVVRLWSTATQGEIKIFIDDAPTPVIDTAFIHLFDGSLPPFQAPLCGPSSGGHYCYLPIPYARHCRIELVGGGQDIYYQVNSLSFPAHRPTTSFAFPLSAADQAAVNATNAAWAQLATPKPTTLPADAASEQAPAGGTLELGAFKGPGVIHRIALALPNASDSDLRRLVLRGYFDGHAVPDVQAPVADFFGNAYGRKPFRTLLLGQAADGSFEADLPMPFAHSARFTLENGTGANQTVRWSADFAAAPFSPAWTGYLHAQFYQQMTQVKQPYPWAHVTGQRGRFVGIAQTCASYAGIEYVEGDDQVRVDDQAWGPSQDPNTVVGPWNGTGTEDCFNSGWGFQTGPNSLPANACLVKDESRGRIACLRWFLNDAPTFQYSLDAQIEHGFNNFGPPTYYSSVSYWYATGQVQPQFFMPAASSLTPPAPPPTRFRVPGGIEGELLAVSAKPTGGSVTIQDMQVFGPSWSNNAQLLWIGKAGDTLTLALPAQAAGTYDLVGYFTKASDYGQASFALNGSPLPTHFDGYHEGVIPSGPVVLGTVTLPGGLSTLVVTMTGKNPQAAKTLFGLDALAFNAPGSVPAALPQP